TTLRPGTYTVTITAASLGHQLEQSHGAVTISTSYNVTLTSGAAVTGKNFAEIDKGSLGGTVFDDINNDGVQQGVEEGLPGITLALTGTNYLGQSVGPITAVTDANGKYSFTNLVPGTYKIVESQAT